MSNDDGVTAADEMEGIALSMPWRIVFSLVPKLRVWECKSSGKLRFADGEGVCGSETFANRVHNEWRSLKDF